jgi:hypothetical protein
MPVQSLGREINRQTLIIDACDTWLDPVGRKEPCVAGPALDE